MPRAKPKPKAKPKAKPKPEPKATANKVLKEANNKRTRTPRQADNRLVEEDEDEELARTCKILGIRVPASAKSSASRGRRTTRASVRAREEEDIEDTSDMMGFPIGFSISDKIREIVTTEKVVEEKHIEYKYIGKENVMRSELYSSLLTFIRRKDSFKILARFMPKMSKLRLENFINEQKFQSSSKNKKVKVQAAAKYIVKKHMKGTRTDAWDMITSIELLNIVDDRETFWQTYLLKKKTNKKNKSILDGIDVAKTPYKNIGKDIKRKFHQELSTSQADINVDCYVKMCEKNGFIYFAARTQKEHEVKSGGVKYDVVNVYFGWKPTSEHFFVNAEEIENCQDFIDAFARTLGYDFGKAHKLTGEGIHGLHNTYIERSQDFTEFKELKELYINAKNNGEETSDDVKDRIKKLFETQSSSSVNELTIVAKKKRPDGEVKIYSKTRIQTTEDEGIFPLLNERYHQGELIINPFIILEMKIKGVNRISVSEEELDA